MKPIFALALAALVALGAPAHAAPSGYHAFKEAASVGMRVVNASTWRARVAVQEAHAAAPDETSAQLQKASFDARYAAEYARVASEELESSCSVGLVLIRETNTLVAQAQEALLEARDAAEAAGAEEAVITSLDVAREELEIAVTSLDEILIAAEKRAAPQPALQASDAVSSVVPPAGRE